MILDIRIRVADQVLKVCILSCDDQVLQIDRTVKFILVIDHIDRGNIVVFPCLLDQFPHRLTDRQVIVDHDKVGGHTASDLILIV